jgi:hypothetical protein
MRKKAQFYSITNIDVIARNSALGCVQDMTVKLINRLFLMGNIVQHHSIPADNLYIFKSITSVSRKIEIRSSTLEFCPTFVYCHMHIAMLLRAIFVRQGEQSEYPG